MARRHPPAADPRRLLRERAAGVLRPLPAAARGSEPDLHVLRVAARRLRIALALLARKPAGRRARRIRRTLRAVLRASGPGRDHDVMAALLARHAADAGCDASGLARRLAAARRRGRRRLAGGLRRVDAARLRLRLARLARNPARGPDARRRVGYALDRQRRAVERALVALGRRADAERLHALRVGCRRLRYTVELRDALARRASAAPERLRAFQDRLGAMHDAYLLARWLAVQARRADGAERHCARALHVAVSRALRAAHADWLALRPRQALRAVWDPAATEEA